MGTEAIAAAMERVAAALRRKPQAGLVEDSAATARWDGGLRTSVHSDSGGVVPTDMPVEIGGEAGAVTPGWLLRAGLASCAATRIAMAAAAQGITLGALEVRATSRSDVRGMLAVDAPDGEHVVEQEADCKRDQDRRKGHRETYRRGRHMATPPTRRGGRSFSFNHPSLDPKADSPTSNSARRRARLSALTTS